MTACTHSTVIEDACNSQPKRINATSPILSHQTIVTMKLHNYHVGKRRSKSLVRLNKLDMSNYI